VKKKGGGVGDHYYRVQIVLPKVPPDVLDAVDKLEAQYRESPRTDLKTSL
jgi:hypothetical protein